MSLSGNTFAANNMTPKSLGLVRLAVWGSWRLCPIARVYLFLRFLAGLTAPRSGGRCLPKILLAWRSAAARERCASLASNWQTSEFRRRRQASMACWCCDFFWYCILGPCVFWWLIQRFVNIILEQVVLRLVPQQHVISRPVALLRHLDVDHVHKFPVLVPPLAAGA